MRIWDIDPGYLNRQSLLGEHRELHGIVSILTRGKKGYSRHPETLRWKGLGWALQKRHALLAAEMTLRGYVDRSPVPTRSSRGLWPEEYIDPPGAQYEILRSKYRDRSPGRIPLPVNAQQLWSQHKYSVLARDPQLYRSLGRDVARLRRGSNFSGVAEILCQVLRTKPSAGRLRNALDHMWGYVRSRPPRSTEDVGPWSSVRMLKEIRVRAMGCEEPYISASTALGELAAWI